MKCNVLVMERIGRVIVGIVLLGMSILGPELDLVWRGVLLVIAAVALITAAIRYGPANPGSDLTCGHRKAE
jgi:hypothetical protein